MGYFLCCSFVLPLFCSLSMVISDYNISQDKNKKIIRPKEEKVRYENYCQYSNERFSSGSHFELVGFGNSEIVCFIIVCPQLFLTNLTPLCKWSIAPLPWPCLRCFYFHTHAWRSLKRARGHVKGLVKFLPFVVLGWIKLTRRLDSCDKPRWERIEKNIH